MVLAWYNGKYWYYERKHPNGNVSLLSLKDNSAGINVPDYKTRYIHTCKDKKQYNAVKYFQEIGVAWFCHLEMPNGT